MKIDILFLLIVIAIVFFGIIVFLFYYNIKKKQKEIKKITEENENETNKLISYEKMKKIFHEEKQNAKNGKISLIYLDVNNFRRLNDGHSKEFENDLMKILSKRLLNNIRESDYLCRYKEGKFIILLNDLEFSRDADMVAKRILKHLSRQYNIEDNLCSVNISIGTSSSLDNVAEFEELLEKAKGMCNNLSEE